MSTWTRILVAFVAAWIVVSAPAVDAAAHSLIDVLVFGADLTIDRSAYPEDVKRAMDAHRRRFSAYRSTRTKPRGRGAGELAMVRDAAIRYERRLVAMTSDPDAPTLAIAYVSELRPCYEWEGFHDCPEREARFAAAYQKAHPAGPFRHYLPLLEAHRWLCAAEGYDYENVPTEAARARQSYQSALAVAKRSRSVLVRTAAEELAIRDTCLAR